MVLGAAVISLAACGSSGRFDGPVAMRTAADGIEFALCAGAEATEIRVEQRNPRLGQDWVTIWWAVGEHTFELGDIVGLNAEVDGFDTRVFETPDIQEGTELVVSLVRDTSPPTSIIADFEPLGSGLLPEGDWLHPDGSLTTAPCEDGST